MCLLTYVPNNEGGFCLASSRDEDLGREKAILPREKVIAGKVVLFPKDPRGGGTWMAWTKKETIVLLNGALENHKKKTSYKHSRGLVILDYFKYSDVNEFLREYVFNELEQFRLVIIDNRREGNIVEIIWDGVNAVAKEFPHDVPKLWCSATLYDVQAASFLQIAFDKFVERMVSGELELYDFHAENTYQNVDHPEVATLTICHSKINKDIVQIFFHDLTVDSKKNIRLYS